MDTDELRPPDAYQRSRLLGENEDDVELQRAIDMSRQEQELADKRAAFSFALSRLRLLAGSTGPDKKFLNHLLHCCEWHLHANMTLPPRTPRGFKPFLKTFKQSSVFNSLILFYESR